MKKFLLCLVLFASLTGSIFAAESNINTQQEKDESKWSSLTCTTVPIIKILEAREAYVVIYQKNRLGIGSVVIPKKWARHTKDNPSKLNVRYVPHVKDAYMIIIKDDGEFKKVILSYTRSKNNSLWGVVDYSKPLEGVDKDTLEEIEL